MWQWNAQSPSVSAVRSKVTVPPGWTLTVCLRGAWSPWPGHQLEEMAVQVDRVAHHRVVDQRDPHPLALAERDRCLDRVELHAVERPHEAFHVAGQVDVELPRRARACRDCGPTRPARDSSDALATPSSPCPGSPVRSTGMGEIVWTAGCIATPGAFGRACHAASPRSRIRLQWPIAACSAMRPCP